MFADIVPIIGGIIGLGGTLFSGIVVWFYHRKATSPAGQHLTRKEKYIHPLIALAGTNLILGIGVALMFLPSAFLQKNATFESWFLLSIMLISCPGFFLILFMLSYLVNVWWYKNDPRRHHKKD
jgi:protein-S-isoprenylcysteine O-methyltransferase Ste14